MTMVDEIHARLTAALAPTELAIDDDSALHAGHAGAAGGGHYRVRITSTAFAGQSRIARHRLVYDALGNLMASGIHALAIDARTPNDG